MSCAKTYTLYESAPGIGWPHVETEQTAKLSRLFLLQLGHGCAYIFAGIPLIIILSVSNPPVGDSGHPEKHRIKIAATAAVKCLIFICLLSFVC